MSDVVGEFVCPNCLTQFSTGDGEFCPDCGFELVDSRPHERPTLPMSTVQTIPEYEIVAHLGIVSGSTVRARNLGAKLLAGLSQNLGGELAGYTRLLQDARAEALQRMCDEAVQLGADAVVGVSMITAELFDIAVELLAFGTAVQLVKA